MQIEFVQSIAHERGSFTNGQIVTVERIPYGWDAWLENGVIRILPEDRTEIAVVTERSECAVVPRQSRSQRRAARRTTMAG